jgi:hypothetical protein
VAVGRLSELPEDVAETRAEYYRVRGELPEVQEREAELVERSCARCGASLGGRDPKGALLQRLV